jgi:pilus assembly protein CpaE
MDTTTRILIVVNSESLLRMLRFYFTKEGYEVEAARTGDTALRELAATSYQAVICDDALPGMDVIQLLRQLRASPITVNLPVVMLASGNAARAEALTKAGATQVARRDGRPEELGEILKGIVDVQAPAEPTQRGQGAHTVTVVSSRGGSGKSFLATNLGVLLAGRRGETAVLADLNLEFGTTAIMLDLRPMYTLRDIAEAQLSGIDDREFDSMLLRHPSGLRVLPAVAQPGDSELIPEGSLPRIMERLRSLYDHVVIDGRPSFREFMLDLWEQSDTLLIACPPEVVSVLVTRSLLEAFNVVNVEPEKALIVLNQVAAKARLTPQQVEKGLNRATFTIPHGGEQLHRSVDIGKAFVMEHPNEPTAVALRRLADLLVARYRDRARLTAPV